jgi:hypothetical protein
MPRADNFAAKQQRGAVRLLTFGTIIIILAAVAVVLTTRSGIVEWVRKIAGGRAQQAENASHFAWVQAALADCDRAAALQKSTLTFMVVPLAGTKAFSESLRARAIEKVGTATLFDSKAALDGLEKGELRLSSEQFVLHAQDVGSGAAHRFSSAAGLATLSSQDTLAGGPYKVWLQTSPEESPAWSASVATGLGSCHWVFPLFRR